MNGKDAIITKIAENAEAEAKKIVAEGKAEAEKILAAAEARAAALIASGENAAKNKAATAYDNKVSVASRNVKNMILLAKQRILDEVYAEAEKHIYGLSPAEYKKLIGALIGKFAENGDAVIVGSEDKKVFTADFIDGIGANRKLKLTLAKEAGDFRKGVVLSGKDYDKNFTVEMILRTVKDNSETAVSKLCFENAKA